MESVVDLSEPVSDEATTISDVIERLAHERGLLQYVVDNLPYLIFWKDRNSRYLGCNRNFAALGGLADPKDVVGRSDDDLPWKEHAPEYQSVDRATMDHGMQRVVALLPEDPSTLVQFLTADSRGKLIPTFVHGVYEQLRSEHDANEDDVARLQQCIAHVKRLVALHGSVAQKTSVDELFCPTETLDLALDLSLDLNDARGGEMRVDRNCAHLPMLRGDQQQVLQILLNLIKNAHQSIAAAGREDKLLTVATERDGETVRFVVADNGLGISDDVKNRIFAQDFTTKEDGHGLGLHASQIMAHELGGKLRFSSDGPGAGARFELEIPLPKSS